MTHSAPLPRLPAGATLAIATRTGTGIELDRVVGTDPATGLPFELNIHPERAFVNAESRPCVCRESRACLCIKTPERIDQTLADTLPPAETEHLHAC